MIPQFVFDEYDQKALDISRVPHMKAYYYELFEQKEVEIIIGFKDRIHGKQFGDSDIALETNMLTALQIIHACQCSHMWDDQEEFRQKLDKQPKFRSSSEKFNISFFPVYWVKNFYRSQKEQKKVK